MDYIIKRENLKIYMIIQLVDTKFSTAQRNDGGSTPLMNIIMAYGGETTPIQIHFTL